MTVIQVQIRLVVDLQMKMTKMKPVNKKRKPDLSLKPPLITKSTANTPKPKRKPKPRRSFTRPKATASTALQGQRRVRFNIFHFHPILTTTPQKMTLKMMTSYLKDKKVI